MSVHRIRDGILIDRASALEIATVIERLGKIDRRELTQRRAELRYALRSTASEIGNGTDVDLAQTQEKQAAQLFWDDNVPSSGHEHEFTTADAAALLGCTEANVRDLLKRGRLDGHRRSGRWVVTSGSLLSRANRRT